MLELNEVYLMDCMEGMRQIPDESIDLILTDPPYGIDFLSNRTENHKKIANDDFETWKKNLPLWIDEFARVLTLSGCCCCCCCGGGKTPVTAIFTMEFVKRLNLIQTVIWDKKTIGLGWKYRPSYETIIVGSKTKTDYNWFTNRKTISNIVRIGNVIPQKGEHPTAKPIELMKHFIELHTEPGMVVLDPFMGHGTTAVAAIDLNRKYIGFEIDPDYYAAMQDRIYHFTRQTTLI